LDILG
jgi:serine/threonine protein kinase